MFGKSNSRGVCVITASFDVVAAGSFQSIVSPTFSAYAFASGRIATEYVKAALAPDAPAPAPYPVQRGLTTPMRLDAQKTGDVQRMQAWAGQSARLARNELASVVAERVWNEAQSLLKN